MEAEALVVGVAEGASCGEEACRLAVDDAEVGDGVYGRGAFLLYEFGLHHVDDGVVDEACGVAVVDFVEESHDLGEEPVANEDGCGVAPACVDGGLSATGVGAVDDVVVEERGVVQQCAARAEGFVAACRCRHQQEAWAQHLAVAGGDIFLHLPQQRVVALRHAVQVFAAHLFKFRLQIHCRE